MTSTHQRPSGDDAYLRHRNLILRLAYDITASWADAEDVAQQAYLRWRAVTTPVLNPRAYLARVATNLALDVVARRDREGYPGPFLPEPIPTGPGADEAVSEAAEVEIALMVVLGSLSALERAVFVLHDVFGFPHGDIADMLGRQPAAIRQMNRRARSHVHARPPRQPVDTAQLSDFTDRFLSAAREGDVATLTTFLTDDARFVGDGGGRVSAARHPVVGAATVARLVVGLAAQVGSEIRAVPVQANNTTGLAIYLGGRLEQVMWFTFTDAGRVDQILAVRNPMKLGHIGGWLDGIGGRQPR